jgi:hypothetical protein
MRHEGSEGGGVMTAYERVLDALRDHGSHVKESGQGKALSPCPSHDDRNPSLSIGLRKDRRGAVVNCHAGCDYRDVLAALNLGASDLFDDASARNIYKARRNAG